MNKLLKYLLLGGAAYVAYRAMKGSLNGMGDSTQEFPSAVLPNMVIGMGPALVPPGTFDIGASFPVTGEAEMRINPDTGTPYWYRTTEIESVPNGSFSDIRNELIPQLPDWVVRRERKRREQLLLDTNASGAMRTALEFEPEEGFALPSDWKITNLLGSYPVKRKRRTRDPMSMHFGMVSGLGSGSPETSYKPSAGNVAWAGGSGVKPLPYVDPNVSGAAREARKATGEDTANVASKKKVFTGGRPIQQVLDELSQTASRNQADALSRERVLRQLGISKSRIATTGIDRIPGRCNVSAAKQALGPVASLTTRVFEFDDCYLVAEGGGIRRTEKSALTSAGGGGAFDMGPDYWGMYDEWMRGQPYGAQTKVKAARWEGDDPSQAILGPDWGGGDNTQLTLKVSGGTSPTVIQQYYPEQYGSSMPSIFDVGSGQVVPEGALEQLF